MLLTTVLVQLKLLLGWYRKCAMIRMQGTKIKWVLPFRIEYCLAVIQQNECKRHEIRCTLDFVGGCCCCLLFEQNHKNCLCIVVPTDGVLPAKICFVFIFIASPSKFIVPMCSSARIFPLYIGRITTIHRIHTIKCRRKCTKDSKHSCYCYTAVTMENITSIPFSGDCVRAHYCTYEIST